MTWRGKKGEKGWYREERANHSAVDDLEEEEIEENAASSESAEDDEPMWLLPMGKREGTRKGKDKKEGVDRGEGGEEEDKGEGIDNVADEERRDKQCML